MSLYQGTDTPGNDNEFAVYNAVQCSDVQWPTSWAVWARDNTAVNKIAPFGTWANAWFHAPCLYWPARAHRPVQVGADGSGNALHSALLIDETLDAATPFPGSLEVRKPRRPRPPRPGRPPRVPRPPAKRAALQTSAPAGSPATRPGRLACSDRRGTEPGTGPG